MSHVIRDSRGTSYELVTPCSPGKSTDKIPLLFEDGRTWEEIYFSVEDWKEANFQYVLAEEELAGGKPCPLLFQTELRGGDLSGQSPKKVLVVGQLPRGKSALALELIRQAAAREDLPIICVDVLDDDGGIYVDPELKKLIEISGDSPMLQSLVDVRQEPVLVPKPKSYAEMFHPVVGKRHKRKKKQRF